jgi:hypothetical protein
MLSQACAARLIDTGHVARPLLAMAPPSPGVRKWDRGG